MANPSVILPYMLYSRPNKIVIEAPLISNNTITIPLYSLSPRIRPARKLTNRTPEIASKLSQSNKKKLLLYRTAGTPSLDLQSIYDSKREKESNGIKQGLFDMQFLQSDFTQTRSFFMSLNSRSAARHRYSRSLDGRKVKDFKLLKPKIPDRLIQMKSPWCFQNIDNRQFSRQ